MSTRRRNTSNRRKASTDSRRSDEGVAKTGHPGSSVHKKSVKGLLSGVSPLTLKASALLTVAIVASVVWNWLDSSVDPRIRTFLHQICNQDTDTICHPGLVPSRRTQVATRKIFRGETILEIPRHLQIWDIDALRDSFVRNELLSSRMADGGPVSTAAFLAAYLVRLQQQITENEHPILVSYITNVLPKYEDFSKFHPLLWSDKELQDNLGRHTSTYSHVQALRADMHAEYNAFCLSSTKFKSEVSQEDYFAARLNVMTRSFGTGKPKVSIHETGTAGNVHSVQSPDWIDDEEISFYKTRAGVDLSHGSHAMVPVLDLYDHHAKPNVVFHYSPHKRAFVVSAATTLAVGQEVFDSYGKRTDSDLFAKFGFVNGDGSEWTQVGLNLWHSPESVIPSTETIKKKRQKALLVNYMKYDDGYANCVDPGQDETSWEFKKLKFRYLLSIASDKSSWIAHMSPRDVSSIPALSNDQLIVLKPLQLADVQNLQFDGTHVFSTCRLLSLTHMDYNQNATAVLREAISYQAGISDEKMGSQETLAKSYVLPPTRDGLEYRTQLCVARLASTALGRFKNSIEQQEELVASLNLEAFRSFNWTVAHLHLGEMQSLKTLQQIAFMSLRRIFGEDALDFETRDPSFSMRDVPCPPDLQRPLLSLI